jgi:undecaprenyl-diphosphatase
MPNFDHQISNYFALMNGKAPAFDHFMLVLSANNLLKGGVIAAFLWYAWFAEMGKWDRVRTQARDDRLSILRVLVCGAVAEMLARGISIMMPFRPRPLFEESLPFLLPSGVTRESLNIATESSFPSDHAVMFFALSAGIWLVSRRAAVLSLLWTTVVIAFPRLYLGLHYFSDLAVGAALGFGVGLAGCCLFPHTPLLKTIVLRSRTHPAYFYPLFFLATYLVTTMLIDLRNLGVLLKTL